MHKRFKPTLYNVKFYAEDFYVYGLKNETFLHFTLQIRQTDGAVRTACGGGVPMVQSSDFCGNEMWQTGVVSMMTRSGLAVFKVTPATVRSVWHGAWTLPEAHTAQ